MKKILLYALGICYAVTFGQEIPDLSPPTPEVAALGKYMDIPMSLHTGTPNISIPITSISDGALSAGVSISYHASGIKVGEMASRVGLGWALQAGGMISRQVRGIADDHTEGFINTSNTVDTFNDQSEADRIRLFQSAMEDQQDFESDMYHINVGGLSGKFFFNQDGTIVVHQKSDLQIVALRDGVSISGWEVTTPMGVLYTFGVIPGTTQAVHEDKLTYFHSSSTNLSTIYKSHTSGWYLTQISDYKGNQIDFGYTKGTTEIQYWNVTGQSKNLLGFGNCSLGSGSATPVSMSEDRYTPIYLSSITTRQGRIVLNYDHDRMDLKHDKALTGVQLIDSNDTLIDSYVLDQGYFIATGFARFSGKGDVDQRTHRLYLKSLTQQKGTVSNKVHRFIYNETHQLPERFSFSQDFWGYYNGADNNVLYPSMVYRPIASPIRVAGADRTVSTDHAKALLLEEIIYPTGGSSKFIFESNTLSGNRDFFGGMKTVSTPITEGYLEMRDIIGSPTKVTSSFTLTEFATISAKVYAETTCNKYAVDCPEINVYNSNGELINAIIKTETQNDILLDLAADTYTVEMSYEIPSDNYINISFFKEELVAVSEDEVKAAVTGGLRIKEIQFMDGTTLINSKKYSYHEFGNATQSSGRSLNPPIFLSRNVPVSAGCSQTILSSNAMFPLNGQSGSHVNYVNVTEYTQGEENGKTEYTYSYAPDGAISASNVFDGQGHLIIPATDYSHRRGQLTHEKHYRYNGASVAMTLIEETIHGYAPKENIHTKNIMMGRVGALNVHTPYNNISERYIPSRTEKTNYYPSGNQTTTTQYGYDTGYTGRTMPITTTITDSKGKTVVARSYYPGDVITKTSLGAPLTDTEFAEMSKLKKDDQYRIGEQIQQDTRIDGVLSSRQRTNYSTFEGITLPGVVQTAKGADALETRIEYLSYDAKGNPLEVKQSNGTPILYIWGYDTTYPIVKISNATYSGMPAGVTTLIEQLQTASDSENTTTQEQSMRDLVDQLRGDDYFKEAQITSFTFDPLVGVTSQTDARGYTMYYSYDPFNRLQFVKDAAGNLISENQYKYKK